MSADAFPPASTEFTVSLTAVKRRGPIGADGETLWLVLPHCSGCMDNPGAIPRLFPVLALKTPDSSGRDRARFRIARPPPAPLLGFPNAKLLINCCE